MSTENKKTFSDLYLEHQGRLCHKWSHYLDIYDRTLSSYRDRPIKVLEIGVYHGGSLQMWKKFFGPEAQLLGVDIDQRCLGYQEDNITIELGDQSDPAFWTDFFARHGKFDIIIDDGSHNNQHQILTFMLAWPHLNDGGVYLVEDLHCSYWAEYAGGFRSKNSFIEFSKDRIDDINAFWSKDPNSFKPNQFTQELFCTSFYDSVAVFEKVLRPAQPYPVATGSPSRQLSPIEERNIKEASEAAQKIKSERR